MPFWWAYYDTYYTTGYPSTARQAVMGHEMGHALGLGHDSTGPGRSVALMHENLNWSYFNCGIYTPQQDDVNGINFLYP